MSSAPILEARRLALRRGRRLVWPDLSLELRPGVTVLLGPNGAGKTTLIDGLLAPDRAAGGAVLLDGEPVARGASLRRYHGRIGHMPQDWRYFDRFTARESVAYVAWLKGIPRTRTTAAAREALARVHLSDHADTRVARMSGGMRQRVGLAEAFVNEPRVVLLDEPTVGLDPAQRASFRDALRSRAGSRAILLSTHLTDDVHAVADRVLVVDKGAILFDGSPAELIELGYRDGATSTLESGYLAVIAREHATESRT